MFLGVDGGGTKTAFALVDRAGRVVARHQEGGLYYLEIGLARAAEVLSRGVSATLGAAGVARDAVESAFIGIPAYGEDSSLQARLDLLPAAALPAGRYRCGNDMLCSWAGSLAGRDGISVVAGTGSIAYGEYQGRSARCGGWGELFGDEGSAYWIARSGLTLFSHMSDGRMPRGPLYELVKRHLNLTADLDLCANVYCAELERGNLAQLAKLVFEAALSGDERARGIYEAAAVQLAAMVLATRRSLEVPDQERLPVSYSGGVFASGSWVLQPFQRALCDSGTAVELCAPTFSPVIGAALLAARWRGVSLDARALSALAQQCGGSVEAQTTPRAE